MFDVRVGRTLADAIAAEHGPERTATGRPSEWDFWSGPLQAARLAFRDFEALPFDDVPSIRHFIHLDPVFGPLVFTGVHLADSAVEIFSVAADPDYWDIVNADPGA